MLQSFFNFLVLFHITALAPCSPADIAPTPSSERTWTTTDMATFWVTLVISIPTYMLAASLMDLGAEQSCMPVAHSQQSCTHLSRIVSGCSTMSRPAHVVQEAHSCVRVYQWTWVCACAWAQACTHTSTNAGLRLEHLAVIIEYKPCHLESLLLQLGCKPMLYTVPMAQPSSAAVALPCSTCPAI